MKRTQISRFETPIMELDKGKKKGKGKEKKAQTPVPKKGMWYWL